jgi:hypothetical protein
VTDCTETFWEDQLATIDAQIAEYASAISALAVNSIQSYTLDTGQTRQVVTKAQLGSLRATYQELLAMRSTIQARVCGATHTGRPVD